MVLFMVAVTWDGQISFLESTAFFGFYVLYLALVLLPSRASGPVEVELEALKCSISTVFHYSSPIFEGSFMFFPD